MADLYRILGMISRGEKHAAGVELGRLLKSEPQNIQAWSLMALAQDDPAKKAQCYQRILQIDPQNNIAREQLEALQITPALNAAPQLAEPEPSQAPDATSQAAPPQAEDVLECPACSHPLTRNARFCPDCGSPVRLDLPAAAPASRTPPDAQEPLAKVEPAPPPAPEISTAPVTPAVITPDPEQAAPLIEPVLAPVEDLFTVAVPPEPLPPLTEGIAPDRQSKAQPSAETIKTEKTKQRPGILVLTSATGAGCLAWMAAMAGITYLMTALDLGSQSWMYAFSLLAFFGVFFLAKNALKRRQKGDAAPASVDARPVVINQTEVRLLLKAGEVHTLFGGDLTLSIAKIKSGRSRRPEAVDFVLQSPGSSRQKFSKISSGARLQYTGQHAYQIDIARAPNTAQSLAMRIRRIDD